MIYVMESIRPKITVSFRILTIWPGASPWVLSWGLLRTLSPNCPGGLASSSWAPPPPCRWRPSSSSSPYGGVAFHLLLLFLLVSLAGGEGFSLPGDCFRKTLGAGAALGII